MNKRQKETQQVFLDSEKAVLKRLEKVYRDALDEINNKIELLLARQDADMAHVIYQVQYQKALKDQVSAILEQLHNNEFETLSEYLAQSYEDGFLGTMYDLQGQGIPLVIPIDQEQIVAAIQHETKLSENLYTALGRDTKDLSKKIAGEISRGISRGMMYSEIARNIAAYGRIPKNNAMRIARTEAHRIQTKAAMDAQWEAKNKGADVVKQWDSTLDGRTRDSHRQVDGEIRELDKPFSNGLLYPGDPSGSASEVVNCRCALLQRAKWALGEEELNTLKERAEYFGLDKTKNFDEYKEKYLQASEHVRKDVQKINETVIDLQEYTVGRTTYKVDGKHVILDNTGKEKETAKLLAESLNKQIQIVPRVVYPQGVSTPDYIIENKKFDLKEPTGSGKNLLYNMVHKKKNQANNFIFDVSNCPLDDDTIYNQVKELYASSHTAFIDEIIIIKGGKVIKKYKRKR